MGLVFVTAIIGIAALVAGVVAALSRHKKAAKRDIKLFGEMAHVEAALEPEGTVIVHGELWPARSGDGLPIASETRVQIIGFQGHLLIVEASH